MEKENRTSEFVISLVGAILGTIGWLPLFIVTIVDGSAPSSPSSDALFIALLLYTLLDIPLTVFNWIGTFKLKKAPKGWGIYFLVTGIIFINVWSMVTGGMLIGRHPKQEQSTSDVVQ